MKTYTYKVASIDCAACAKELEEEIGKIDGVQNCTIDFGVTSTVKYDCEPEQAEEIEKEMRRLIIDDQGKNTKITAVNDPVRTYEYVIESIDCAACAKELEEEIGKIDGVRNAQIEFGVRSRLSYETDSSHASAVEEQMKKLIREDQGENTKITRVNGLEKKTYEYVIESIDCAACAKELEEEIGKLEGVENCSIDFGVRSHLKYDVAPSKSSAAEAAMKKLIREDQGENTKITRIGEKKEKQAEEEEEEKDNRLPRIIIGGILFVIGLFLNGIPQIAVSLVSYVILGYDVLIKAVRNIGRGQLFDEHFLMAVATIAAIYLKDWKEAAGVMLFYQIGEYFQDLAVRRSRKSIGQLMDIRPDYAYVKRDEEYIQVDPSEVDVDEIIRVRPGEKIPLDGEVVSGASSLDTSSLTGESRPRDVDVGDEVISGSLNQTGVLEIRVSKVYAESTVSRILDLVENSESKKAKTEKFITKFSKYYTPIVVFSAIAVAVIVGIVMNDVNEGIRRACTFLVISCPCALVISIPLSFFAGIGGLSGRGVLVKGADVIETLAKLQNVVMDKTGTLTTGQFAVEEVLDAKKDRQTVINDAAYAEHFSNHPIAQGIRAAADVKISDDEVSDVQELAGRGLSVMVKGRNILAGNAKLMMDHGISFKEQDEAGTLVYVAENGQYEGCLVLRDQLKPDAADAVKQLHNEGKKVMMVSGDSKAICRLVGDKLGVDAVYGECMPEDKVNTVEELKKDGLTAFVGDGVNDAPVLALSDVGFAMGALGSDAAIEAADVVLMDDQPSKIALTISSAKRIMRIANENIYGAITIKIVTLILGALGIASMWMAIFADTGVALLCVLNSMRLLHIADRKKEAKA